MGEYYRINEQINVNIEKLKIHGKGVLYTPSDYPSSPNDGPEFIANISKQRSKMHGIEFKYIQPGKPTQNAYRIKRFDGSYRRGVLNKYIFESIRSSKSHCPTID